jgi:hypothetical protein
VMKQALDSHGNDEADSNSGKRMHGGIEWFPHGASWWTLVNHVDKYPYLSMWPDNTKPTWMDIIITTEWLRSNMNKQNQCNHHWQHTTIPPSNANISILVIWHRYSSLAKIQILMGRVRLVPIWKYTHTHFGMFKY